MTLIDIVKDYDEGNVSYEEVVKYINQHPEELSMVDENGLNVMCHVRGCPIMTKLLLDSKVDPNRTFYGPDRTTDLMMLVMNFDMFEIPPPEEIERKLKCIKLLLDASSNPNARDKEGRTALMYAAVHPNTTYIKLLLDSNANPDYSDRNNKIALHHALTGIYNSHPSINERVKLLVYHSNEDNISVGIKTLLEEERKRTVSEITGMMCLEHIDVPPEIKLDIVEKLN